MKDGNTVQQKSSLWEYQAICLWTEAEAQWDPHPKHTSEIKTRKRPVVDALRLSNTNELKVRSCTEILTDDYRTLLVTRNAVSGSKPAIDWYITLNNRCMKDAFCVVFYAFTGFVCSRNVRVRIAQAGWKRLCKTKAALCACVFQTAIIWSVMHALWQHSSVVCHRDENNDNTGHPSSTSTETVSQRWMQQVSMNTTITSTDTGHSRLVSIW